MEGIDALLVAFFVMNISVVLLMDSQVLLPAAIYPVFLRNVVECYAVRSGDFLLINKPSYFRGLVLAEMCFQLPLLIANAYAFYHGKSWGRMTGIIYGVHTATTMVPILYDIIDSGVASRSTLLMTYVPCLIFPLLVIVRVLPIEHPFKKEGSKTD